MKMWKPVYTQKRGAKEIEGEARGYGKFKAKGNSWAFSIGTEVFPTEEQALSAAEGQRLARIASLRKSLAKLEALSHSRA